jgi:hypothetical protein
MGLLTDEATVHSKSVSKQQKNEDNEGTTFGATHCSLHLVDGNDVKIVWLLSTEIDLLTWDAAVVTFLKENHMSIDNQTTINCCTEYKPSEKAHIRYGTLQCDTSHFFCGPSTNNYVKTHVILRYLRD